jgi:hypothetical protein
MKKSEFTLVHLVRTGCLIVSVYFLMSVHPGMLRAKDQAVSAQPLPSAGITGTDLTSKCLECHKYTEHHHPIGIVPLQASHYEFPLYDGKIMCLTCHIEDHLEGGINLLRDGPYIDRREMCFKCHTEGEYANINPHIMLDNRGNVLSVNGQPVCLFCHSSKPTPAAERTGDVLFRADVAFLCLRCHSPMENKKCFAEHFLVTPSMDMRRFMEKKEQQLRAILPLEPRERITCSTCHNPHQKGVIISEYSASGADAPHRLRLPATDICIACHNIS